MSNHNIKALVIDDSSVIRRLMGIALDRMGLEADFVENGVDALARLQEKDTHYDIIFLDIMMEGMDGYKVCKFIKSQPDTRDIPVVMLTSRDGAIDKIRGKLAGANHYLTKPVKMSEFRDTIEKFVPIDTRQAAADKAAADAAKKQAQQRPTQPVKLRAVPPLQPKPAEQVKPVEAAETKEETGNTSITRQLSREEKIAQIRKMMEKK